MAYQAWSVVFGEQPSAAKWNILGTNDAAFNSGGGVLSTGLTEAFLRGRYQPLGVDSTVTGYTPQWGWHFITATGTTVNSRVITFDEAYTTAPIVVAVKIGQRNGSDPSAISDLNNATSNERKTFIRVDAISTTGFTAVLLTGDAAANTSGYRHGFAWLALGVV